jgi:hypothetical protein
MPHALDAPELLDVEMDELARFLSLVADDRRGRLQVLDTGEPLALEDGPLRSSVASGAGDQFPAPPIDTDAAEQ